MAKPWLWLLAGPDGSGKSTFAASEVFTRLTKTPETAAPIYLCPDNVVAQLRTERSELSPTQAWRVASERTDAEVSRHLRDGRSMVVETILSTTKFEPIVEEAKTRGYLIGVVYVVLQRPSLHVERIAQRVGLGGHDVAGEKVIERWVRGMGTLPWFAERADYFAMWDNSKAGGPPKLMLEAAAGKLFVDPSTTAAIKSDDTHPSLQNALSTVVSRLAA